MLILCLDKSVNNRLCLLCFRTVGSAIQWRDNCTMVVTNFVHQFISKLLSWHWQEGWLSPTERSSVSAISLRHIIWLPHESHAGMSLPTSVLGCRIWLRQESLRHILASHGYAPGTIAVNVSLHGSKENSMLVKRIAACTHLSSTVSH